MEIVGWPFLLLGSNESLALAFYNKIYEQIQSFENISGKIPRVYFFFHDTFFGLSEHKTSFSQRMVLFRFLKFDIIIAKS